MCLEVLFFVISEVSQCFGVFFAGFCGEKAILVIMQKNNWRWVFINANFSLSNPFYFFL